ncbi:MAG: hypothetical protein C5B58_13050 [Acidobacteria bacterium]|nr:MAG: hypothetical protein C5B58_13050 [Acidobacteriota bacterium]
MSAISRDHLREERKLKIEVARAFGNTPGCAIEFAPARGRNLSINGESAPRASAVAAMQAGSQSPSLASLRAEPSYQ